MRVLTNPTFPSYMQWVNADSTTISESFLDENWINSKNHHFWGNISAFFLQQICGIKPRAEHVVIEPHLPKGLSFACGCFESIFGTIKVSLKKESGEVIAKIDYPPEAQKHMIIKT